KAYSETDLVSSEPVTVVLSEKGWVRAAKGHDIDPKGLNYKAGDSFSLSAKGRSQQGVIFLDSTGRAYTVAAHTLPSARGQGEPLTGKINPPSGAEFRAVLMGKEGQKLLMMSDAGYGFVSSIDQLQSKNKAGKAAITLPKNAEVMHPMVIDDVESQLLAAVTNEGRMLVFPVKDLPELAKGKGNKIISIPSARAQSKDELMTNVAIFSEADFVVIHSGKRHLKLKYSDLQHYVGERGRRGQKLPRGLQRVDRIEIIKTGKADAEPEAEQQAE
ncbi:DNA gyrase C-terminal beta-propeller domain-containing protein, partial [Oleiphilus sp. HI0066]